MQVLCSRRCEHCFSSTQTEAVSGRARSIDEMHCVVDQHPVGREVTQGAGLGVKTFSPESQECPFPDKRSISSEITLYLFR